MEAVGAKLVGHVVRRGLEQFPAGAPEFNFNGQPVPVEGGHDKPVLNIPPGAIIGAAIILFIATVICFSIDYTIGNLMASLAMIESPSTATILDPNPPAYTDEPDDTVPKNTSNVDDIPVLMVKSVPITSQATYKFLAHLKSVGGFFARWRGLKQYLLYGLCINVLAQIVGAILGTFLNHHVGEVIGLLIATMVTIRLHTLWTHGMIGSQSSIPWYKRFVSRKQAKVLLLPTIVYALAQQLTIVVPIAVAFMLRLNTLNRPERMEEMKDISNAQVAGLIFSFLAVPASAAIVVLTVLLPAKATLIRMEACLLSEEQEAIVSFDRETIMGEIDVNERGSSKKLFVAAWKSFSRAARWRVVKVYLKSFLYQAYIAFGGAVLAATFFWLLARNDIKKYFNEIGQEHH